MPRRLVQEESESDSEIENSSEVEETDNSNEMTETDSEIENSSEVEEVEIDNSNDSGSETDEDDESYEGIKTQVFKKKLSVVHQHKMSYKDTIRFLGGFSTSPFHKTKCCIWIGIQKKEDNVAPNLKDYGSRIPDKCKKQGTFWIDRSKKPIHRVVYNNFVGPLYKGEILKTTCKNRLCININHFTVKNKK